ncbi:hypothetical protein [Amedibacillus sp. YH-ame10]
MSNEQKLIYMLDTCCTTREDLDLLLSWIDEEGIDEVYKIVHYMFDEDEHIKPGR